MPLGFAVDGLGLAIVSLADWRVTATGPYPMQSSGARGSPVNQWIWVVLAVVVIAILGFVVFRLLRERRSQRLRTGFGPEYDRTVHEAEDKRSAEAELSQRQKRRSALDIRPLSTESREQYSEQWRQTETHFVDRPVEAVAQADHEVVEVMRARGYPVDDFDRRASDISVDYPDIVENYRAAHDISTRAAAGAASTEDLRVAVIHYRSLFEELLGSDRDDEQLDGDRDPARDSQGPTHTTPEEN